MCNIVKAQRSHGEVVYFVAQKREPMQRANAPWQCVEGGQERISRSHERDVNYAWSSEGLWIIRQSGNRNRFCSRGQSKKRFHHFCCSVDDSYVIILYSASFYGCSPLMVFHGWKQEPFCSHLLPITDVS